MQKSFTKGVLKPFRNILLNRKTNSFNDAVKDALILELELEEDKILDRRKRVDSVKCYKCGRVGHKAVACRGGKEVNAVDSKHVTCYNCGKIGHIVRDCRSVKQNRSVNNNYQITNRSFENKTAGNDLRLPCTSRNGGLEPTKSRDYKITKHT